MKAAVIGAGLAGCEAAWQLKNAGVPVELYEMKPVRFSPAHKSENFAELVCSNSFKAERPFSAAGLLKAEMRLLGSLCLKCAGETRVPAGGALAVDREAFSAAVTARIEAEPLIRVLRREVTKLPDADAVVVAAGPLASEGLSGTIRAICGESLSFYDAAAPIVSADSIDMDFAFACSRYGRGGGDDYLNCPMDRERYEAFYEAVLKAERAPLHLFDPKKDVYEGCVPIEVLASRGKDAMRYGPLKPVGLTDPATGRRPWANLQLRRENRAGTMYNLVGFQTNLKFGEQKRVFSLIPALHAAEFLRCGVMHRNTFIRSPELLDRTFKMTGAKNLWFAGQITGVEGYMESAASGIVAGLNAARRLLGKAPFVPPPTTMMGALCIYVSDGPAGNFQPMGANFGLLPSFPEKIRNRDERNAALALRAVRDLRRALEKLA